MFHRVVFQPSGLVLKILVEAPQAGDFSGARFGVILVDALHIGQKRVGIAELCAQYHLLADGSKGNGFQIGIVSREGKAASGGHQIAQKQTKIAIIGFYRARGAPFDGAHIDEVIPQKLGCGDIHNGETLHDLTSASLNLQTIL